MRITNNWSKKKRKMCPVKKEGAVPGGGESHLQEAVSQSGTTGKGALKRTGGSIAWGVGLGITRKSCGGHGKIQKTQKV